MCIKLELIKELYYDARPNKSQDLYTNSPHTLKDLNLVYIELTPDFEITNKQKISECNEKF